VRELAPARDGTLPVVLQKRRPAADETKRKFFSFLFFFRLDFDCGRRSGSRTLANLPADAAMPEAAETGMTASRSRTSKARIFSKLFGSAKSARGGRSSAWRLCVMGLPPVTQRLVILIADFSFRRISERPVCRPQSRTRQDHLREPRFGMTSSLAATLNHRFCLGRSG